MYKGSVLPPLLHCASQSQPRVVGLLWPCTGCSHWEKLTSATTAAKDNFWFRGSARFSPKPPFAPIGVCPTRLTNDRATVPTSSFHRRRTLDVPLAPSDPTTSIFSGRPLTSYLISPLRPREPSAQRDLSFGNCETVAERTIGYREGTV